MYLKHQLQHCAYAQKTDQLKDEVLCRDSPLGTVQEQEHCGFRSTSTEISEAPTPVEAWSSSSVWFIFVGVRVNLTLALILDDREPKVRKGKTKTLFAGVKMMLITIIYKKPIVSANYPWGIITTFFLMNYQTHFVLF